MCGRARCTLRHDDIHRACHLTGRPLRSVDTDRYQPSYNVSPGRDLTVVRRDDGSGGDGAVLQCMKWGLIPSFTKKTEKPDHYKMFNARSESICEKASFRRLVPNNRCLVAVEGFYEWKKDGSKKQPYYVHFKDGRPLVFAALYDSWKNSEGEILYTFTIVTTSSSPALEWLHVPCHHFFWKEMFLEAFVHICRPYWISQREPCAQDRMPVILGDKESTETWLIGSSSSKFDTVLKPYEAVDLVWYPVTPAIGKASFDGPECIKEIKLKSEATYPISKFFSKKGANSEQESKPQVGSMHKLPIKTNHHKSLKEEPETEDDVDCPSLTEESSDGSKPNVSTLSDKAAANLPIKREYEEFSADMKPCIGETNKPQISLPKKKGNLGAAGDKQPTLFSYFGKK